MTSSHDPYDRESAAAYLEHSKWLLEWHNKRSEAATNRAVAMLGFLGIILAAILQGAALLDGDLGALTWVLLALTSTALLGAAFFALRAIGVKAVPMQDIAGLRRSWAAHVQPGADRTPSEFQFVESFLNSTNARGASPVAAARDEADDRVSAFKMSVHVTAGALVLLTFLAISVAATAGGGEHEQQRERERAPGERR